MKNHNTELWTKVQKGLMSKGYPLPKYGADGEPGEETAKVMLDAIEDLKGVTPAPKPPEAPKDEPEINVPLPPGPSAPSRIALPLESNGSLNRFYGTASRKANYLAWFNFPVGDVKLYSKTGASLSDYDGDGNDEHRCHKAIAKDLEAALLDVYHTIGKDEFYRQGWNIYAGCYNYRTKSGGSSLSTHAWGIAVDINPGPNGWRHYGTTFSDDALDAMERHGFLSAYRAWGHDAMHFQRCRFATLVPGEYYHREGYPSWIASA